MFGIEPIEKTTKSEDRPQFTPPDHPALNAKTEGAPGTHPCAGLDLGNGVNRLWDASRQVSVSHTNSSFSLTLTSCKDRNGVTYPTGWEANIVGNDDADTMDENNVPYPSGQLTSNDHPSRAIYYSEGVAGDWVQFDLKFQEFTRLKVHDTWYRISPFYPWMVIFRMEKGASGWQKGPSLLINGSN